MIKGIGGEEGDEDIVFDESQLEEKKKDILRLAINDYINERSNIIGQ